MCLKKMKTRIYAAPAVEGLNGSGAKRGLINKKPQISLNRKPHAMRLLKTIDCYRAMI